VRVFLRLGSRAGCDCSWNRGPSLLEARPAEHGTTLSGLEGNGGFGGALRTNCPGFCADATACSGHTLDFALFATLWIVLELLIVKEKLLTGGKDKVITAIRTFQYLVDEVHYASPRACLGIFQYSVDKGRIGIVSPTSYFVCNSTTFLAFA
jgi:hypothetical protein